MMGRLSLGRLRGTRTAIRPVTELQFLILTGRWREDGMVVGFARLAVSWLSFHAIGDYLGEHLAGPRDETTGLRILRAYEKLVANHPAELAAITPPRMLAVGEGAIRELRALVLSPRPVMTTCRLRTVFAASRPTWKLEHLVQQEIVARWERSWGPGEGELRLGSDEARFWATLGSRPASPQGPHPAAATQ